MRVPKLLLPFLLLSSFLFLGVRIHGFVRLFFEHAGIAVTQQEIKQAYENDKVGNVTRKEEIPRIIHQVFHNWRDRGNETVPGDWDEVRRGCQDWNPGWEYIVGLVYRFFFFFFPSFFIGFWGLGGGEVKVEGRDSSELEIDANVRNFVVMDRDNVEEIYRGELSLVFEDV